MGDFSTISQVAANDSRMGEVLAWTDSWLYRWPYRGGIDSRDGACNMTPAKVIAITLAAFGLYFVGLAALEHQYKRGYEAGFEYGEYRGKAEAKTPAYIVETCSAWWWGSNKEATKMLKKYCEMKK